MGRKRFPQQITNTEYNLLLFLREFQPDDAHEVPIATRLTHLLQADAESPYGRWLRNRGFGPDPKPTETR